MNGLVTIIKWYVSLCYITFIVKRPYSLNWHVFDMICSNLNFMLVFDDFYIDATFVIDYMIVNG